MLRPNLPSQENESGGGGGDRTQNGEQDGEEHGSSHVPASSGAPAAGLEGEANQDDEGEEESEEDEAPAADGWGAAGEAENDGRSLLKTSQVRGGAPAGRAASKKLERLGNKHGLELDDRLAELLRYGEGHSLILDLHTYLCTKCFWLLN